MKENKIGEAIFRHKWARGSIMLGVVLATLGLTGCGTTSGLKGTAGNSSVDLSQFERVVVRDFVDKASEHAKDSDRQRKQAQMRRVTSAFADMVAWEIGQEHAFQQVIRNGTEDEKTLVLTGQITRYEEGDPNLRLWVGMGAGSSYFDARVELLKGVSGELLGAIEANRNSWVLGGGIAATQTPDGFMREAARKVAEELCTRKAGRAPAAIADNR
jgi:uncharacterized protein DUF4410